MPKLYIFDMYENSLIPLEQEVKYIKTSCTQADMEYKLTHGETTLMYGTLGECSHALEGLAKAIENGDRLFRVKEGSKW